MRTLLVLASVVTCVAVLAGPRAAVAEERIALIIGNGAYSSIAPLENPVSDAELMAQSLEAVGFQVTLLTDTDLTTLKRAVAEFGRDLREAGQDATGLFYYAGHGVQSFGANYLLPTDSEVTDPADLDFVALEAQSVLRQMYSARNRTNIVILDACRNNPFESIPDFGDSGLAEMKAPTGTFLAYATEPGGVALDGTGLNSPFSAALAREMREPGRPIEEVFRNVRVAVLEETGGAQTPWDTSSLTAEFAFVETEPVDPALVAAQELWEGVKATNDPVQIMLFLRGYGDSPFADEARALLAGLVAQEVQGGQAQPAPAPAPAQPSAREQELIAAAQASGTREDYEAYLTEFPEGVFAEFARTEVDTLQKKDPIAGLPVAAAPTPPEPTITAPDASTLAIPNAISFGQPISSPSPELDGRTIAELVLGSPLFPPIEGLPPELWQGQSCSNCHEWTQTALCDQGLVYVNRQDVAERSLQKVHPYGGGFKQVLKVWADDGCN
ncbi:MAG: caspase family protein [Pseudomonadota bacterium]